METQPETFTETSTQESPIETTENETFEEPDTDIFLEKVTETQEVRVSRFGLGIYPEIPQDYPDQDIWDRLEDISDPIHGKRVELIDRVRIKLWKQGTKTVGGSYSAKTHRVYPSIPDVAYVRWKYFEEPDGTLSRFASFVSGGPGPAAEAYFDRGEIPPGITVIPYDEAGIDPYTFLEFKYE